LLALAAAGYLAIGLLLLGEFILGSSEGRIASSSIGDMTRYFVFMRGYAAEELASGNLPLWNPYSFSGTPLAGAFQPSVFYLPNFHYVFLPLALSIDLELWLHIALLATATFAWLRGWRLDVWACFFGGCVAAFSGASFLRLLAGQVTVLDTLAWSPLLLLTLDRLAERVTLGRVLCGIVTVTLMLLAGHPPTFFMCGVLTALYCIPILLGSPQRGRLVLALSAIAVAPIGLAAVHLFTGLEMASHGIRAGGMPFEFATSFSLPPENLLTLIAPEMLGEGSAFKRSYFGRWFYWDASVYMGVVALILAIYGALAGRSSLRVRASALFAIALVLALGAHTPLYEWVHAWVPGFDRFRAPSKFAFHAALFGAALCAIGVDRLLAEPSRARVAAIGATAFAIVVSGLALWAWQWPPTGSGQSLPEVLGQLNDQRSLTPLNLMRWNETLQGTLRLSLSLCAGAAALLFLAPRRRWAMPLLIALGIAELLAFAYTNRGGTRVGAEYLRRPGLPALYERSGEDRSLLLGKTSNIAMQMRAYDLWGYEPINLGRYARFMARTQGRPVEALNNIGGTHPDQFHPLFAMLRGRYAIDGAGQVTEYPGAWPRFVLVREHRVVAGPEAALDAMFEADFDPRVPVLESAPLPAPDPKGSGGSVRLLEESTDHFDIAVGLDSAALLLIGDSYAPGWRVRDLETGRVDAYRVQPANSVLRAIALPAGEHRLRVEYVPAGYRIGRWVSGVSGLLFAGAVVIWARGRPRA
jgi:hypothetical protein